MNQEYVTALVRHILTAVGGFAIARGKTDNATVETIIGGVIAAIGLGWSLLHKKALLTKK
jgi:hypothetical protein